MRRLTVWCFEDRCGNASQRLRQFLLPSRIFGNWPIRTNRAKKERSNFVGVRSSSRKHDDHVFFWEDCYALAATTYCFENRWSRRIDPPAVSVADAFANDSLCGTGFFYPLNRNNLLIFPTSVIEIEKAESRHVTRMQMKIAPTVCAAVWIGWPDNVNNADWLEQIFLRELEQTLAG